MYSFLALQKLQNCTFGHKHELWEFKTLILIVVVLILGLPFPIQYYLQIFSFHLWIIRI